MVAQPIFTIRFVDQMVTPRQVVACDDDAAALGHACTVVRELRRGGGYVDPDLRFSRTRLRRERRQSTSYTRKGLSIIRLDSGKCGSVQVSDIRLLPSKVLPKVKLPARRR